jgi:mono/diheme cytochrome c family protein
MTFQQMAAGLSLVLLVASVARADDEKPVSYYNQVRPIFQARCHGCHQPAKTGGEFVMTEFPRLLQGGESEEPAVVPGKPDESYLIVMVTPEDRVARMPPEGESLSEAELAVIRRWIQKGARDDTPESAQKAYDADRPPVYKMPPVLTSLDNSPGGELLAVSGCHEVLLHQPDGSELVGRLVGISLRIDAARVVAGSSQRGTGHVQVFHAADGKLMARMTGQGGGVFTVAFRPDGKQAASGGFDGMVRINDVATGELIKSFVPVPVE